MKFKFIIEKTTTGFSAFCSDKPIFTTGKSILELQSNTLEACNLYLEEVGKSLKIENLEFELDFKQFFTHYKLINSKHLAKRIGMNESLLSQYITGKKKPSILQIDRLVRGLNDIGRELMDIRLV